MADDKIIEFEGTPLKCTYNSENFKIYGCEVDASKYKVKLNKYNNVAILGNLHELGIGVEYKIKAKEEIGKYGVQYKVINIKREKPTTEKGTRLFLNEILTGNQADVLMKVYPDIVDRVMTNRLDDIDLNKTKGIKEYTFGVIKTKIIENFALAELVDEFKGLLNLQVLRSLYLKYPSTQMIKEQLSKNPYKCLCGLSRIGFKTADGILMELEKESKKAIEKGEKPPIKFDFDLISSELRMKASILYLLDENEKDGHTSMKLKTLMGRAEQLSRKCMHHFINVLKSESEIYVNKKEGICGLNSTYEKEQYIAEVIKGSIKSPNIWKVEDLEKYREIRGIKATDRQFSILDTICKNNISILAGYSGSGKSQSTNMVINMARDNNKSFTILAPTGKASRVSSSYTGVEASTIHRGLSYQPTGEWGYNEKCKLPYDIVIVDEYSMADTDLSYRLFQAIDFNMTKLLIVGDPAQLSSVGAGNLLHDFIKSKVMSVVMLDKIFRYGVGGLTTVATKIREGSKYLKEGKDVQVFGEDKAYTFIPSTSDKIISRTTKLYSKLMEKYEPEEIMILSPYNKGSAGSIALNKAIQPVANEHYGTNKKVSFGESVFYLNDLVIQNVNNYKAKPYMDYKNINESDFVFGEEGENLFISNGDVGKLREIQKDKNIIRFEDDIIEYKREDLSMLKLAYSISVHRSQGSENKIIIFISDKAHTFMLNSNLMYVAVTRAKEKCFHIGNPMTVNSAVKKKANLQRSTNMQRLLKI